MAVSEWIRVPDSIARSQPPTDQTVSGVRVTVYVSPFDAPSAVRGRFDSEIGRYVIEFKYQGDDRIERVRRGNLTLRVGKKTKRLFGIEVDPSQVDKRDITIQIVNDASSELQHMSEAAQDVRQRLNLGVASRALDATGPQISGVVEVPTRLVGDLVARKRQP